MAGTRPRHRAWRRPRLAVPVLLLLLAAGAWFGRDLLPEALDFTKDHTTRPEALQPERVRASSEARGHPATSAFDGFSNRYWSPSAKGGDQYLEADFARPVRLRNVLVFPGTSAKQDEFLTQARPAAITLTLTSADGQTTTRTVKLRDEPGQQTFTVRGSDVIRVRLTVTDQFGATADRRLAVAEVEFFGRHARR
ncbi:discoidin domain-containing protein [Streptomyces capparidis]